MLNLIFRKLIKYTIIITIIISTLVLGNLYTYMRFTDERPIAELTFTPVNNQEFDVHMRLGNFCGVKTYRLYGDDWRIDARFLKWKSWATLFGADSLYRIERLSGRYAKIEDENTKPRSAYNINTNSTIELGELAEKYSKLFPMVDTLYGSSTYEKMDRNLVFTVYRAQSGILVREQQKAPETVYLNCLPNKSIIKNSIIKVDQSLASAIEFITIHYL